MNIDKLKEIIKESVKDVFREELKDIILEALKSKDSPLNNSTNTQTKKEVSVDNYDKDAVRKIYESYMNPSTPKLFQPNPGADVINSELPAGEVGLDQIMGLVKKQ